MGMLAVSLNACIVSFFKAGMSLVYLCQTMADTCMKVYSMYLMCKHLITKFSKRWSIRKRREERVEKKEKRKGERDRETERERDREGERQRDRAGPEAAPWKRYGHRAGL